MFRLAYETRLQGGYNPTVMVAAICRCSMLESSRSPKEGEQMTVAVGSHIIPRQRPEETFGSTKKYNIGGCGKLYVTVNQDEEGVCEVFTSTGSEGCEAMADALARLISISHTVWRRD